MYLHEKSRLPNGLRSLIFIQFLKLQNVYHLVKCKRKTIIHNSRLVIPELRFTTDPDFLFFMSYHKSQKKKLPGSPLLILT